MAPIPVFCIDRFLTVRPYRAPFWLPGAHLQTIVPARLAPHANIVYRRERWQTPDEDFIDLDWADPSSSPMQGMPAATPIVVVFHGLEGSSLSRYARGLMREANRLGWRGVVPHFRGCSGEINLTARFYHSGDSDELDWILRRLRSDHPRAPLCAAGISLGGNVLLKWLGERGPDAAHIVTAAAAVSAPVDLGAGAGALKSGPNMVYTRDFMRSLKSKSIAKLGQYPGLFDRSAMLGTRDLTEFDDLITAPLHGFHDADDYYRRSSANSWLQAIKVPTLMLNALNDPFLPATRLPAHDEVSRHVVLDYPEAGGHVGFWSADAPGSEWMPTRVMRFLSGGG